jgi:hypothetical protein
MILAMSPLGAILLFVVVLAVLGLLLCAVIAWARRRTRRVEAELVAELGDDTPLIGPQKAVYRGGSGPYPKVKGNGLIVLTQRRLIFRILLGTNVEIPCVEITGVREGKHFRGAVVGGQMHLIVGTHSGEVGFFVPDPAAWLAALARVTQARH